MIRWAVVFLALPLYAFPFGKEGRHMVVQIAHALLDQQVIAAVDHYLGTSQWTEASDWLETSTTPRNAEIRKQWQRVLVPRDQTYTPSKTPNLVNQLNFQLMVLDKKSMFPAKDVSEAIKTLFALVASAHQPLRCGYPDDDGGASVNIKCASKSLSLLRFWDHELLIQKKCDMWGCTKVIMGIPPKEKHQIETATVTDWIAESRAQLTNVYAYKNGLADDTYLESSHKIAEMQIIKGGLRLAAILNKYFKG